MPSSTEGRSYIFSDAYAEQILDRLSQIVELVHEVLTLRASDEGTDGAVASPSSTLLDELF